MEWVNILERLPRGHCIVCVRREGGKEVIAYFHSDKMAWLAYYHKRHELSHWQCFESHEWLHDVQQWKDDIK